MEAFKGIPFAVPSKLFSHVCCVVSTEGLCTFLKGVFRGLYLQFKVRPVLIPSGLKRFDKTGPSFKPLLDMRTMNFAR